MAPHEYFYVCETGMNGNLVLDRLILGLYVRSQLVFHCSSFPSFSLQVQRGQTGRAKKQSDLGSGRPRRGGRSSVSTFTPSRTTLVLLILVCLTYKVSRTTACLLTAGTRPVSTQFRCLGHILRPLRPQDEVKYKGHWNTRESQRHGLSSIRQFSLCSI